MTANYRWGSRGNVISAIDSLRQDLNPHYTMNRGEIGGSFNTKFISDFDYADQFAGYAADNLQFTVYDVDDPRGTRHQALQSSIGTRTQGWSYTQVITLEPASYMVLCVGAGGGAASSGSNRGGGGGAGGGLAYMNFTLTASTTCNVFVGMPGITISSSTASNGSCGGSSGVQLNNIDICAATGGQGGFLANSNGSGSTSGFSLGGERKLLSFTYSSVNMSSSGISQGGGTGGRGGYWSYNNAGGAGGGAAGYSGAGGNGASTNNNVGGGNGSGGGGGGGSVQAQNCGGGGGVGIYGQGSSGNVGTAGGFGGFGGSGGDQGYTGSSNSDGGNYGGGGGADDDDYISGTGYNGYGGSGVVVIATQQSGGYPNSFGAPAAEVVNSLTTATPAQQYFSNP